MLFNLLKLCGLDVAAEIEAAKAGLEQRAERAAARIRTVVGDAAVIATLGALAAATAMMALVVGLIALYRFTAQVYGDYAGLGAVAAILIVMTAAFATVIFLKARKLSSPAAPNAANGTLIRGTNAVEQPVAMSTTAREPDHYFVPSRSPAAARDLIDPLALVLSEIVQVPRLGNPVVDDLIGKIRTTARGSADEAVYRAADVIRYGRPADLILVLTGTAALAWLITRNARPRP
jgi:plasmid stabilization system protein ParE